MAKQTQAQREAYALVRQELRRERYDDQPMETPDEVREAVAMIYSESVRLEQLASRLESLLNSADDNAATE